MKPYKDHMRSCPKCGSYSIAGPAYECTLGRERIKWSCRDCGFEETTYCKDHKPAEPIKISSKIFGAR